ncbi:MAG: phage holin family protein [Cyclobacteriaceae bacterium]|nr:phage holin family protein [Cyclobacteriaceae bacterium]
MKFLVQILISAVAIIVAQWILPGVTVESFLTSVLLAVVLSFLNALVKPVLVFLTLPATVITLGLFLLVINAVIILLADWLVPGFSVDGFWWALIFSIILSLVTSVFNGLAGTKD